jgi:predicted transcriptional regulator
MQKNYRSRTDIIVQILHATNRGMPKTKIMYKVFLSYEQMQEYLDILIQSGLLEYLQVTQTYKTTEKGLKFLRVYEQMQAEQSTTNTNTQIK